MFVRSCIIVPFLLFTLFTVNAASAEEDQHVLCNSYLRVVIDLGTGTITELRDLGRPDDEGIFLNGDRVLTLAAGDFWLCRFSKVHGDLTSVTLTSPEFQKGAERLPLLTTIWYRLEGPRISIDYSFEAKERMELDGGLHINISSPSWDSLLVRNHYSGEAPVVFSQTGNVRHFALNQMYELRDAKRRLMLVFPNPYQSLVRVSTTPPHSFLFRWYVLIGTHPFGAADIHGTQLASVLTPGVKLHRHLELIVPREDDEVTPPIAYFSPFPNGYDQVITMTFDDIPFVCWKYPKSSHDPHAPMQQYLVRLLEDHPKMKMGWIILPDKILDEDDLATHEYPAGKWWLARGKYRILTEAPEDYRQWIRNIDRDSVVYGYEDRVHLGNHGYHHTPEMEFGSNFEFQYYDPAFDDSTFRVIVEEYRLLGLSEKSHKWIRFPGFHFSRSTVDALIKYGFVFFDYWNIYNKMPWMLFYSEHGRIWGAGTWWQGDIPGTYEDMDRILRDGKLCHTSGHPPYWFDGDPEAAYEEIHGIFEQAENNYPNLGYLFPDDVGYFADETYDIHGIDAGFIGDELILYFTGSASRSQTIVLEWPHDVQFPTTATVDDVPVARIETRGRRLLLVLPELADGSHFVRVPYAPDDSSDVVPPAAIVLYQNYPNPFNPSTMILYYASNECRVTLDIYDIAGRPIARLLEREHTPAGFHTAEWLGVDGAGEAVSAGVYICRLTDGRETVSRKIVLLR